MTRFVYNTACTLNGYLADEHDSLSWLFVVPGAAEAENEMAEFIPGIGAMVLGATTYEWVLENEERKNPGSWAEAYGAMPTFVATHRQIEAPVGGDVRFVSGGVAQWVDQVVDAAAGKDVWVMGGGDLVGQFDDAGLLHEVRVSIAPVVLPAGRPLLPRRIESDRLHLEGVRQAGQFAELTYRVTRPA